MTDLRITSPCAADWNAMTPAAAGRHCAACDKEVIDIACLSPAARDLALKRLELAVASGRKVCVRAPASADGRLHGRSLRRRVLTGGMATVLAMTMAGCQGEGPVTTAQQPTPITVTTPVTTPTPVPTPLPTVEPEPITPMMMGAVAAPPPAVDPVETTQVIMGDVAEPPAPVVMGKISCIKPVEPVEPVRMGEMTIATPVVAAPVAPEATPAPAK